MGRSEIHTGEQPERDEDECLGPLRRSDTSRKRRDGGVEKSQVARANLRVLRAGAEQVMKAQGAGAADLGIPPHDAGEAITDSLRMELRPFGVDVTIIEPGTIRTEFASRVIAEADAARPAGSRYSTVYARQAELAARFDRLASGPAPVTRALVRVIDRRRPPTRVVAPRRFIVMIGLVKLLPVCLTDWVMRRIAGLDRLAPVV